MRTVEVEIDANSRGEEFPPIHEGRYEVDPEKTQIVPPHPGLVDAVRRAGIRLLRIGVGVWLPTQEPNDQEIQEREWFVGSTLEDAADESKYVWTHLDRILDTCLTLGCELLLSVDYMPATLALRRKWELPEWAAGFAPGYTFPDGIRNAPALDPAVFTAASLHLLQHVEDRGAAIRYVELWNEPDLPFWWCGSFDEFWTQYRDFAKAVSAAGYRVGGPSWAGLEPDKWLHDFVKRVAAERVPLDFYSWHQYPREPEGIFRQARLVRKTLDEAGLAATESVLDEWGFDLQDAPYWGTAAHAAYTAACFMGLPDVGVSAQTETLLVDPVAPGMGRFHGLTTKDGDVNPVYYTHEAFEAFRSTPIRLGTKGYEHLLAGTDSGGARAQFIAANPGKQPLTLLMKLIGTTASGSIRRLTQESFDNGGWSAAEPAKFGPNSQEVSLPPETFLVFEGNIPS